MVDRAFTVLYQEYYPTIRSFISKNSGSDQDAADIFQDALIVFYDKIRDENFELSCTIKTYVYSICRNLWLKKLTRKKQHLITKESFETISLEANIDEILEDTEQTNMVVQLLKQMSEDCLLYTSPSPRD